MRPIEFLREAEHVDIAVIGEGEYTMLDIMEYYTGGKILVKFQAVPIEKTIK